MIQTMIRPILRACSDYYMFDNKGQQGQ